MSLLTTAEQRLLSNRIFLSLKFTALISGISWKMYRKSCTDPKVQSHLGDKDISFQLQTRNGRIVRHFVVTGQRITSSWGAQGSPDLVIAFGDAVIGARILSAEGKRLAFMQAMQNNEVDMQGDLSLFLWYVELGSMLNQ